MRLRFRGQVSLEYLMTYGWAIMLVLGIVIIAWNMGYIDIAGEVEPGQLGFWGVVPYDYALHTDGSFDLMLENQLDHRVEVKQVEMVLGQEERSVWAPANWGFIEPGNVSELHSLDTDFFKRTRGKNYRLFMNITYEETEIGTPQSHMSSGWIWSFTEN
ncbi:MAG: hypothetical protein ABH950_01165 [Candidatus Altiarchaeota archaeon]